METSTLNRRAVGPYGHWNTTLVGDFNPGLFFGFLYRIAHVESGRAYIGLKHFRLKGRAPNWKNYTGSCQPLNHAIYTLGKPAFTFHILTLCTSQDGLRLAEELLLQQLNVLTATLPTGEPAFWNRNIAGFKHHTHESSHRH